MSSSAPARASGSKRSSRARPQSSSAKGPERVSLRWSRSRSGSRPGPAASQSTTPLRADRSRPRAGCRRRSRRARSTAAHLRAGPRARSASARSTFAVSGRQTSRDGVGESGEGVRLRRLAAQAAQRRRNARQSPKSGSGTARGGCAPVSRRSSDQSASPTRPRESGQGTRSPSSGGGEAARSVSRAATPLSISARVGPIATRSSEPFTSRRRRGPPWSRPSSR